MKTQLIAISWCSYIVMLYRRNGFSNATNIEKAPQNAIALVVIGEDPYAEMMGDIKGSRTLEYAKGRSYAADRLLRT